MKYFFISLIFLIILASNISFLYAQVSDNVLAEFCEKNWRQAPDMCSEFIPEGYYEEKASKGELTKEDIIKLDELEASVFGSVNCPVGSHQKAISGEIICVDNNDPRIIVEPLSTQLGTGETQDYIIAGVVGIIILAIIIGIVKSRSGRPELEREPGEISVGARKSFSKLVKEAVKEQQQGRCAVCGEIPTHWEFDHINRRDDNDISNCQGLCLDCHQDKTLRER